MRLSALLLALLLFCTACTPGIQMPSGPAGTEAIDLTPGAGGTSGNTRAHGNAYADRIPGASATAAARAALQGPRQHG